MSQSDALVLAPAEVLPIRRKSIPPGGWQCRIPAVDNFQSAVDNFQVAGWTSLGEAVVGPDDIQLFHDECATFIAQAVARNPGEFLACWVVQHNRVMLRQGWDSAQRRSVNRHAIQRVRLCVWNVTDYGPARPAEIALYRLIATC